MIHFLLYEILRVKTKIIKAHDIDINNEWKNYNFITYETIKF